jgi:catechol 2,3-dioxygenase-like lactoylglutathione lyase family enzyme
MTTIGPVTIAGYSHVAISVTDLEAARTFYCGILGFEELPRPDFGFPGLWLRVGDLQLHLGVVDEMKSAAGFPHFALYVPTDEFDATMNALRDAGVKMLGKPSSREDFGTTIWQAFASDPSGNVIELTNAGPLQSGPR